MLQRIQESNEVLNTLKGRPLPITPEVLEALKYAIAKHFELPTMADYKVFDKTSEEYIEMESALGNCCVAVFRHYKPENSETEGTAIFLLAQHQEDNFMLWTSYKDDLSDLKLVDQSQNMRA